MPDRHPSISPSGRPYGPPATEKQWAELHRDMFPRESWQPDHDERIGLGRGRDYEAVAPTAAEAALTLERHGHMVQLDAQGLSIDGKRVPGSTLPTKVETRLPGDPYNSQAFQVTDQGAVVLHGRIVAQLQAGAEPRLYGDAAPAWARGAGHTVVADARGLSIDGQRVSDQPLSPPVGHSPLRINNDGTVTWCVEVEEDDKKKRKHEPIADLTPKKGTSPVVRQRGAKQAHRQAEEAERRRRDDGYRARQKQQEALTLTPQGQELTL
ncbi:hypothetical protein [Streptomyces sp. LN325]|uniref:hypothetical protein n=1 Tax=Streptomyces sp. LN325 TaxID=3112976 RepID=UPI0037188770